MDSNAQYRALSKFYDIFDAGFWLGGKGNPRSGLPEVIPDEPLQILDVCTGTAASALWLASHNPGNTITAIDLSPDMLAVARRKIEQRGVSNVRVSSMDATQMTCADEAFDVVMVSLALHEMEPALRDGVVREMARVLKRGGVMCVIDFAQQEGWLNRLFVGVWRMVEPPCFRSFLEIDWREFSARYGFELHEIREYSFSNLYALRKL